jgi:hypothetical protein
LTGKKLLNGFLDRLRENLETLDEQIETARVMSKKKGKDANALQWTKTLRDLVELRSVQLDKVKAHLLGRDETGVINEPEDCWSKNPQIMFERYFNYYLSPWRESDLKLECEDCGVKSEDVSNHTFTHPYPNSTEHIDLCEKCYNKRTTQSSEESENADQTVEPASKGK